MKKVLIVALMVMAGSSYAGHPRCAGSYEPAKCEALEAKLAAETPEQRKARTASLEASRQAAMKEVATKPATASGPTCTYPKGWAQIGMDKEEVIRCGWGKPDKINRYTNATGTEEQWVYRTRIDGYLYFDTRGILRSMTH